MLKKGNLNWTPAALSAFQQLKAALMSTPVLALPNFSYPETDACNNGIGAVLMQFGRPIAFLSKALAPTHRGLSTYEKELLAILMAVNKWRHYLYGRAFIIRTDHQSLKYLMEQGITTALQLKWLTKLLGYYYTV